MINSCIIRIWKFGSFKNPFATITSLPATITSLPATITSLPELYFRFRRFILSVQMKKVISMNEDSCTSGWKPWRWVRLDLIFTTWDTYTNSNLNPLSKFTSMSRSTESKVIFIWNISQMITKTIPISTRIVISYAMKQGISFRV